MRHVALILSLLMVLSGGVSSAQDSSADARAKLGKIARTPGIGVLVGSPGDAFVLDLARSTKLILSVRLADADQANSLRKAADAAGLLGTRIYVEQGSPDRLSLADNTADAVIVTGEAPEKEVLRVARPGAAILAGGETKTKPFPKGADEWTHPYHGPDNNPQSRDRLAKGPFMTRFMAEPWYAAMHQVSVFGGGRIYKAFGNRTSTQAHWPMINTLFALSAWNGSMLWKRPLSDGFMIHRNTMIATDDALLMADDTSLKTIDGATGEVVNEYVVPDGISDGPVWKWMALQDGILYALVGEKEPKVGVVKGTRFRGAGWPWWKIEQYRFGFGRTLFAMDFKSKKILWTYRDEQPLDARAMAMATGKLYIYSPGKFLGAVEQKTGKLLWKNSDEDMLKAVGEQRPAQRAYWGFASSTFVKATDKALYFSGPTQVRLCGVSAENGKLLFAHPEGNYQVVVREDGVYCMGPGSRSSKGSMKLHPTTGEVIERFMGRIACTRATGSEDFIFVRGGRGGGTSVYDVRSAKPTQGLISPMRPACQDGVIVANGGFYWGPWICRCDTTQIGVINLGSGGDFDYEAKAADAILSGPANIDGAAATDADWPTYRRDNARSVRSPRSVAGKVAVKWTYTSSGTSVPTAPIVVGDSVFISGGSGAVRALDGASGKVRWTSYTGGRVMYSPTYWKGRILVGSGDGYVTCYAAADGKEIWKFRAAPAERRIPVYSQLLSTWPVGTGVLVENGVAYAAAGNANYDGTHVYALDAATGKIKWQNHTSGHLYANNPNSGAGVQGHLLLHDGALFMSGGNHVPIAKYEIATGKFSPAGAPERRKVHGRDLYVADGKINSTGYPLYWRPLDQHFISTAGFAAPGGVLAIAGNRVSLLGNQKDDKGNRRPRWSATPFQETAAAAIAQNAVVLTGVDRTGTGPNVRTTSWICALNLEDGTELWRHSLDAAPVLFGIAIDPVGNILVSLQDGRVICYAKAE